MAYAYDEVVRWAKHFLPELGFSQGPAGRPEPYYPIDGDGWLGHVADERVTEPPASDPLHRGTAVYRWRAGDGTLPAAEWPRQPPRVAAGDLTLDAGPDGIGGVELAAAPPAGGEAPGGALGDWFLDVGGWGDEQERTAGQAGYLWDLYHGVFEALGMPASAPPVEPIPSGAQPPPAAFAPDDRGLHAYAELTDLATLIDRLLTVGGLPDELSWAAGAATQLREAVPDFLWSDDVITYYLLYPVRAPEGGLLMEGQWEAISVFLSGLARDDPEPAYASYSQGYGGGVFPLPRASCREWSRIRTSDDTHPVAFVGWGSHANYFTSGEEPPDVVLQTVAVLGDMLMSAGSALILFGAIFTGPAAPLIAFVGLVLLVLGFLLALAAWIAGLIEDHQDHQNQGDLPSRQDDGAGPDRHGGDSPPAGGDSVGTPDDPPEPGTWPIPMIVHPISDHPEATDPRLDPPPWWSYAGRWGVCVADAEVNASWSNGVWRRWPNGYTLAHRNAEALLDLLHRAPAGG